MRTAEIRESFLSYMESKGCVRRPSSSLVPDDPSLLLTTAGMVQFKPVFLGLADLGHTKATTCQKCVRTTDIDTVGHTGRHHTFFEMLGNFSFGDYFKSEACAWAYEYSVDVLGIDPGRIWYSIFEDDDEAEAIWRDEVGVPSERIVRLGADDNFWSAGPTGPCGPCSELYYDQGAEVGCGSPDCMPGCDCDRFLEYWNLVFMQYDRGDDGSLAPLPSRNIDTGMGLERIASIMQGVSSNFETDDLRALVAVAEDVSGVTYGASETTDVSLRILSDHARAMAFLISDGVLPSNEKRGYILRRLLRRAVRHGRLLGVEEPFLTTLTVVVIEQMGADYPELLEHRELVSRLVDSEERRFAATLRQGLEYLDGEIEQAKAAGLDVFDGAKAFTLHDTYGFPVELTAEIVGEAGLTVDRDVFDAEMQAQRERGRAAIKDDSWDQGAVAVFAEALEGSPEIDFVGYEADEADATVLAVIVDGAAVDEAGEGVQAEIVLDATPFYAEQGGQVGDAGVIDSAGARFEVADTIAPVEGVVAHHGTVATGTFRVGDSVRAVIDARRRDRIRRNHTATHLLHWALRLVLGEHVRQSGSFVAPDRLRFDFTHFEAPADDELAKVERLVNAKLMEDHLVMAYETSLESARESGVTALFGEKYGEFVRVLEVGNFSKELCGGTHVSRTSEIGLLKVSSEGSVGANLRRIEAVTSFDAMDAVYHEEDLLARTAASLKARTEEVPERVESLLARVKAAEKAVADLKRASSSGDVEELVAQAVDVGYPLIVSVIDAADAGELRDLSDVLRAKNDGGAVVLVAATSDKVLMLAAGSDAAIAAGFDAGAVIREISPHVGGGGGGKPAMAQAGGKDASGIPAALATARKLLGAD